MSTQIRRIPRMAPRGTLTHDAWNQLAEEVERLGRWNPVSPILVGLDATGFRIALDPDAAIESTSDDALEDRLNDLDVVTGSGTPNYLPLWLTASTLGDSILKQKTVIGEIFVGISTPDPEYKLHIKDGDLYVAGIDAEAAAFITVGQARKSQLVGYTASGRCELWAQSVVNPTSTLLVFACNPESGNGLFDFISSQSGSNNFPDLRLSDNDGNTRTGATGTLSDGTAVQSGLIFTIGTGASLVTVRKNSGTNVGTRRRLNFIEGSNVTITTTDDAGNDEVDITIAAAGGGVTDHGALTGLGDDDHTIYALLAGRAGGQALIGGTASGNKLTLQSTSNATRGGVELAADDWLIFDEMTAPGTPAAGKVAVYAKSDNKLYRKGEDGVEAELGGTLDINGLTTDNAPDPASDFLPYYDTSEGANNKATFSKFIQEGAAVQSQMEGGNSLNTLVVPGRQHYHPSACKGWVWVTVSGTTPTVAASYNVTSVVRDSQGTYTVNWATDFSSANYAVAVAAGGSNVGLGKLADSGALAAGSTQVVILSTAFAGIDPSYFAVIAFGDHA